MRDPFERPRIVRPPDSHADLTEMAQRALKDAEVHGELPTDLDKVLDAADISIMEDTAGLREDFLSSFVDELKGIASQALDKLKGVADLREEAVWVASGDRPQETMFPKAHETSHHLIPWHRFDPGYKDGSASLSPKVKAQFEREANFMAAELIFQGNMFKERARSYRASLQAAFKLADNHLATYQSTIWKYVEVLDEAVAVAQYYPKLRDRYDQPVTFSLWCTVGSDAFREKCGDIDLPSVISSSDGSSFSWTQAVGKDDVCSGTCRIPCGNSKQKFQWESWWNGYTLFVLIRRPPSLSFISDAVRQISQ